MPVKKALVVEQPWLDPRCHILKIPSPYPSILLWLNFTLNFVYFLFLRGAGWQGMRVVISLSHITFAAHSSWWKDPSDSAPPALGSSPRTVFHDYLKFECFPWSIVLKEWLWHGVQSFRNRVLQLWSPTGPQVLPAKLFHCGLLWSPGHRSFQEPAPVWTTHKITASSEPPSSPVWTSHKITASSEHPSAPEWGPAQAVGGSLIHCEPSWAAVGQLPHHGLQHRFQGLPNIEHLLPLLHWPSCLRIFALPFSLFSMAAGFLQQLFVSFLTMLFQRLYHYFWGVQLLPAAGPSWCQRALVLLDMWEVYGSFSQKPLLSTNTWSCKPNTGVRVMGYFSFWFCFSPSF